MSNIIKSHLVMDEPPKILSTLVIDNTEPSHTSEENSAASIELEKEKLEELKLESSNILSETENMILELMEKARTDAKNLINDAQEEASAARAQAQEEAGELRRQAQEEGYREGLEKARQEIEAERITALEQSQALIQEARQTKLQTMKSAEGDISRLVMAVSKKVIAAEIISNPKVITDIVREAISFLDDPENITVYVNPNDMENLMAGIDAHELTEPGEKEALVEVRPLDKIDAGGCVVDSEIGRVDARMETRMANVEKAMTQVAENG
ncbi:MAG TPA: FliH/SctL family protein [Syntrophomonadaceae bacterium]|nr:FliH/SctL family protein [Syntrophomonadaceae bacterium]